MSILEILTFMINKKEKMNILKEHKSRTKYFTFQIYIILNIMKIKIIQIFLILSSYIEKKVILLYNYNIYIYLKQVYL